MTKKTYVVETTSTFRIKYLVVSEEEPKANILQGMIDSSDLVEWKQDYLGEKICGLVPATSREIETINDSEVNELAKVVEINDDNNNDSGVDKGSE